MDWEEKTLEDGEEMKVKGIISPLVHHNLFLAVFLSEDAFVGSSQWRHKSQSTRETWVLEKPGV